LLFDIPIPFCQKLLSALLSRFYLVHFCVYAAGSCPGRIFAVHIISSYSFFFSFGFISIS
jgi:hypothetical protein